MPSATIAGASPRRGPPLLAAAIGVVNVVWPPRGKDVSPDVQEVPTERPQRDWAAVSSALAKRLSGLGYTVMLGLAARCGRDLAACVFHGLCRLHGSAVLLCGGRRGSPTASPK